MKDILEIINLPQLLLNTLKTNAILKEFFQNTNRCILSNIIHESLMNGFDLEFKENDIEILYKKHECKGIRSIHFIEFINCLELVFKENLQKEALTNSLITKIIILIYGMIKYEHAAYKNIINDIIIQINQNPIDYIYMNKLKKNLRTLVHPS